MSKLIAIDGSRAFLKDKTGTENYSYQLIKNIALIDSSQKYLIYIRPGVKIDKALWPDNFQFKVINYPRLWTQVGLFIQTFKDPIDLLFVPSHTVPLFRRSNIPTVMTVHDLGAEFLPKSHQFKQQLYLKFITDIQLKSVTKLIAVSKATKEDLVSKIGIKENKIEVIYEGVDKQYFKPSKLKDIDLHIKGFDIEKDSYFLFVGTIQPRKNLIKLIESYKEFLDNSPSSTIKLVIAGGLGWDYDQILQKPKELGIESKVIFLGRVKDEDLPYLYSGALAFCFISLFEGFGLPILEAMACGCPVIASNTSSIPEITGESALLVDPNSTKQISQAMSQIAKNDIIRDRLIEKGYINSKRFSWETAAKLTVDLFREILNNHTQ